MHKIRNGWVYPLGDRQNIDRYMIAVGLNPEDDNLDPTNLVGLGNLVGKRVTEWLAANDGLQKDNGWIDVRDWNVLPQSIPIWAWHGINGNPASRVVADSKA